MYSLLPSSVRLKERYLKMVNLAILDKVYCYLGSKSLGFCHLINSPLSVLNSVPVFIFPELSENA